MNKVLLATIFTIFNVAFCLPTERNRNFENEISGRIKQQFIEKTGITPDQWKLMSYAAVDGEEEVIFAKVQFGESHFVHLRIRTPNTLEGYRGGATMASSLQFFESGTFEGFPQSALPRVHVITRPTTTTTTTTTESSQSGRNKQFENCVATVMKSKFIEETSLIPSQWDLVSYGQVADDPDCYFAKIQYGPNVFVHLRVRLPDTLEGYKLRQSKSDTLQYFENGVKE